MPNQQPRTFFELFKVGVLELEPIVGKQQARISVEALILVVFSLKKSEFISLFSEKIPNVPYDAYKKLFNRLKTGEPLAYVLGETLFMGQRYVLEPGVLIPRIETEGLVERVVSFFSKNHNQRGTLFELGIGSGVVSIEVARRFPDVSVLGWDISEIAYNVAQKNLSNQNLSNVSFFCGDFFQNSQDSFMKEPPVVFVSNPPYIPSSDVLELDASVRNFEPHLALDGGYDGLTFYKRLFGYSNYFDAMFFEIGFDLKSGLEIALRNFKGTYCFENDSFGQDRYLILYR